MTGAALALAGSFLASCETNCKGAALALAADFWTSEAVPFAVFRSWPDDGLAASGTAIHIANTPIQCRI